MNSELFIKDVRKLIQKLDNNASDNLNGNNKLKVKRYLKVPYFEKDEAKQLGAKWDNKIKAWFIPEGVESLPFEKWILKREQAIYIEPNIRTKGFYIVESKELCWKCLKITKVFGFLLSKDNEHIEDIYDEDNDTSCDEWVKFGSEVFITYVEFLSKEALTIMEKFSSNYYYDFSKFIQDKYYINHCEHCGSNQGDHFMFHEHDGAFCSPSIAETKQMKFYWFEEFLEASIGGYVAIDFLEIHSLDSNKIDRLNI